MEEILIIFLLVLLQEIDQSHGIGCYVCTNGNGNEECDSLNNSSSTEKFYKDPCMAGRKVWTGRQEGFQYKEALFPASACLKVSGRYANDSGERLVVRSCVLDSGSVTSETEIIRQNMCGQFVFDNRNINGCIKVCDDVDGCNGVFPTSSTSRMIVMISLIVCLL